MKRFSLLLTLACSPVSADIIERGEYLFDAANCYACHTDTDNDGAALAGGRALDSEYGTFYSPNITPDEATGIGGWSDEDFIRAMKEGIAPDGRHYFPSFPYLAYRHMERDDMLALKAYLFSLDPVEQQNREHEVIWYLSSLSMSAWKRLHDVRGGPALYDGSRGSYLIDVLGHCNECHTPRNAMGMLDLSRRYAGNEDMSAPAIDGDALSEWDEEAMENLFLYGELIDGDYVADHMAEVVDYSTSRWKEADLRAAIGHLLGER